MKHPELRLTAGDMYEYDTPQGVVRVYFRNAALMALLWEVKTPVYWQPEPWDGYVTRKVGPIMQNDTVFSRDYPMYRMECEKVPYPLPPKRNPFYPEEHR